MVDVQTYVSIWKGGINVHVVKVSYSHGMKRRVQVIKCLIGVNSCTLHYPIKNKAGFSYHFSFLNGCSI